jgi:hypothetical protein
MMAIGAWRGGRRELPVFRLASITVVLALLAQVASASDGVLEINQTCVANGCFPGDGAGFPVTIDGSAGHSYRLTSDLTVPDTNTTAISVQADNITIDLAGFEILGPNTCSFAGCSASGAGGGIVGSFAVGASVHDGTVEGMGANGIELGELARVERISARSNGAFGIDVGVGSVVLANRVTFNGDGGMLLSGRSAYADNVIRGDGRPSVAFQFGVASATGGNMCDDKLCSARGERRYYLTKTGVTGDHALTACSSGYHMASLWEIRDTAVLTYDKELGFNSFADQGDGPPEGRTGWVRTGYVGNSTNQASANCQGWRPARSPAHRP